MANSGDRIAKQYVLEKEITKKHTGQQFLAIDEKGSLPVVVTIIRAENILDRTRLIAATQLQSHIHHPNISQIYTTGELDNGDVYIVSEFMNGFELQEIVPKDQGLPLSDAWLIVSQIASGLSVAHEAGLLHLNLEPSSIFVSHDEDENETFKIMDFGIAPFLTDATGLLKHEQETSVQSDVYGLGTLLAFIVGGKRYLPGSLKTTNPVQKVVEIATNPDPKKRYATVDAFLDHLSEIHRKQMTIPETENSAEEPSENLTEFGLGRFLIASVVLSLVGFTVLLYYWLVSST